MVENTHIEEYGIEVLHEDNHTIVVNKKASDIVQGDKTGDEPLPEKIKQYLNTTTAINIYYFGSRER